MCGKDDDAIKGNCNSRNSKRLESHSCAESTAAHAIDHTHAFAWVMTLAIIATAMFMCDEVIDIDDDIDDYSDCIHHDILVAEQEVAVTKTLGQRLKDKLAIFIRNQERTHCRRRRGRPRYASRVACVDLGRGISRFIEGRPLPFGEWRAHPEQRRAEGALHVI